MRRRVGVVDLERDREREYGAERPTGRRSSSGDLDREREEDESREDVRRRLAAG